MQSTPGVYGVGGECTPRVNGVEEGIQLLDYMEQVENGLLEYMEQEENVLLEYMEQDKLV